MGGTPMLLEEDFKKKFLNQFENEDTVHTYNRIFIRAEEIEESKNKDLLNFNKKDLHDFIKYNLKPQTKESARTYCTVLRKYIQWGIDQGYSDLKENPFGHHKNAMDYFVSFVTNQNELYLRKDQIDGVITNMANHQDKFLIRALFEGIHGTGVSELTLLTRKQIDDAVRDGGQLKLVDIKGRERYIKAEYATLFLARRANDESEYDRKNGEVDYSSKVKESVRLPSSDYILKPTATKPKNDNSQDHTDNPVSKYTVYNRLEMIKGLDEYKDMSQTLHTKNIMKSGMIYEAKKLMDEGEDLSSKKTIEKICSKFGMNYKWSLRDFLNEETVREVYGD